MARDMHEANAMKLAANLLKIRLSAVAMGLLISTSLTQAALIDNGGFTTDTETGLDWLDMYHTVADSYNTTLAEISTGELVGWRFATSAEFDGLINAAVGSPYTQVGNDPAIYSEMVALINLFGSTFDDVVEGPVGSYAYGYVDSSELSDANVLMFGYSTMGGIEEGIVESESGYNFDRPKKSSSSQIGAFLVRATSVPDTGSTAALLGAGVVALAFARRKLG